MDEIDKAHRWIPHVKPLPTHQTTLQINHKKLMKLTESS